MIPILNTWGMKFESLLGQLKATYVSAASCITQSRRLIQMLCNITKYKKWNGVYRGCFRQVYKKGVSLSIIYIVIILHASPAS